MCFLDKEKFIEIRSTRDLPHWHQNGKIQFITFRLADSLPQIKIAELKTEKYKFEIAHPKPWSDEIKRLYRENIGIVSEKLLDNGYGSCILKSKSVREIVATAIKYFDNERYRLLAFVIMPNHVHLIIHLLGTYDARTCMHSIKSYTSNAINRMTNKTGSLWQKENFDTLIRSSYHLRDCIEYIKENPRHLHQDEYELYICDEFK